MSADESIPRDRAWTYLVNVHERAKAQAARHDEHAQRRQPADPKPDDLASATVDWPDGGSPTVVFGPPGADLEARRVGHAQMAVDGIETAWIVCETDDVYDLGKCR